jgi:hypothetical protein
MEVLKLPLSIGCLLKVLRWVSGTHLPWEKTSKGLKAESCFISVCLVMLASQASYGQAFREYQVKAAFVYNFAQFTEWPADAFPSTNSPLVIGVFGKNPFDDFLKETVQNETLRGHPVQLKQCTLLSQAETCHILYIGMSERAHLEQIVQALRTRPILTVSDVENANHAGVMIQLLTEGNRVRFRINQAAVKAARLNVSSKLLNLAQKE